MREAGRLRQWEESKKKDRGASSEDLPPYLTLFLNQVLFDNTDIQTRP